MATFVAVTLGNCTFRPTRRIRVIWPRQ